jgi:hypothetical protein
MPAIMRSSRYYGSQDDYARISQFFAICTWDPSVHTVYITNGWHTGSEGRMVQVTPGVFESRLMTVTYCGYCLNVDGSAKIHYYAN